VFGLKPTYGRLPRSGTFPFAHSLDHLGPFARTVADLAAVYDALQGPDPNDPACAQRAVEPVGAALTLPVGIRIGVLGGWFYEWADLPARRAVETAASALGATTTVDLRGAEAARAAAFIITAAEGGALHREGLTKQFDRFEPHSRSRLVAGSLIPASWVVQAQRVRQRVYLEAIDLFGRFDLLIAAATPVSAPLIGAEMFTVNGRTLPTRAGLGVLTQPISCIGLPVCAVPIVQDMAHGGEAAAAQAMPLGVQLIGAPWREDMCLAAARALERAGVARFTEAGDGASM
jgi:Asp-tRNA(Asn)/Glu-tRNA(Gln) amidotransferase A subunit family amidase